MRLVTPRNSQWRGTFSEWEQRLDKVLKRGKFSEVIEILRLTDQTQLDGAGETGPVSGSCRWRTLLPAPSP